MKWFKRHSNRPITVKIAAHSIPEEHLFIDTMRCQACGDSPVQRVMHSFPCTWTLKCTSCDQTHELVSERSLIMTDEYLRVLESDSPTKIRRYQRRYNHAEEPSNIIDLTVWLQLITLCMAEMHGLTEREGRESGRYVSAEFHLVQCLYEALKFYASDEDFPPRDAFFSEQTYASYEADTSAFSQDLLRSILAQQRPLNEIEGDLDRIEDEAREKK